MLKLLLIAGSSAIMFLWLTRSASAKDPLPLTKATIKDESGATLPYQIMTPAKAEVGKKYPLVIFLHGAGERGTDNEKQLVHGVPQFASEENRKKYPCFLIAPQCPDGKKWVEVDWSADSHTMPKEVSISEKLTLELIDQLLKDHPIDPKRIYLTGLSMGGYGTWDLLARKPELFAAGVPVCGGADEKTAQTLKKMPIWAFHGTKDTAVKPARSRNMVKALLEAGGHPKYTEYPEVGHNSWDKAYSDPEMFTWLFTQKKN
ncbi:carboxylesterase family protein [Zavarzinella formosa]|uniref:carboxylesterase family protein n=1 Tax=Zavarzinella formosa TaxID=360055 RepID=UPI000360B104|nr:prolyl oligopeptidase family serine peptidase [Zavarzinella formosa]